MLRNKKKQPKTMAEKVSKLLMAHPDGSDSDENSDMDVDPEAPRVVDFEPDEYDLPDGRSTEIRKRNVKMLSEQSNRYKGKISSRKELEMEAEDKEDGESDDSDDDGQELAYEESDSEDEVALNAFNKKLKNGQKNQEEDDDSEADSSDAFGNGNDQENGSDGDSEDDEDDFDDDEEEEGEDEEDNEGLETQDIMTKTNQQAEIQKGVCVQNQLRIWERLLEVRINTQKVTTKTNQLPAPSVLQNLSSENEELQAVLQEAQERSSKLLQQLLALQSALSQQNSELRKSVKRKQPPESSHGPPSKRFAETLQNNFQQSRGYRNEVLLKWDDRTKLLTPGAGAKRKSLQEEYDIIKKIDSAMANREALIEKTQILKNQQEQNPENEPQRQPHIYDDSDFYHQQLRELIEYKASTSSNMSEITQQFVELQKLRQKMKKKVDTRASKGRKLRYVVHNKLINFMAPNEASDWTESSKNELYKSLFV